MSTGLENIKQSHSKYYDYWKTCKIIQLLRATEVRHLIWVCIWWLICSVDWVEVVFIRYIALMGAK